MTVQKGGWDYFNESWTSDNRLESRDLNTAIDFADAPAGNVRTFNGTSAQTAAITGTYVRVVATSACSIAVGTNPTAVLNTSLYIPANVPTIVKIDSGDKIAAIDDGTTGSLYYHVVQ